MKFLVWIMLAVFVCGADVHALQKEYYTNFMHARSEYLVNKKRKNARGIQIWADKLWYAYKNLMARRTKSQNVRSLPKWVKHEEVATAWKEIAETDMAAIKKDLKIAFEKRAGTQALDMRGLDALIDSDPLYKHLFPELYDTLKALPTTIETEIAKRVQPLQQTIADLQDNKAHLNRLLDKKEIFIAQANEDARKAEKAIKTLNAKIKQFKKEKELTQSFTKANAAVDEAYQRYDAVTHDSHASETEIKLALENLRNVWGIYEQAAQGQIGSIKESLYQSLIKGSLGLS